MPSSIIESALDLNTLKKRVAYLIAFRKYIGDKLQNRSFSVPKFEADYVDNAFLNAVKIIQRIHFGAAIKLLQKSSDAYDFI